MSKARFGQKGGTISFAAAPMLRVCLNIGCLMDVITGTYYKGKDGESISNGGLANFTGIAGEPNLGKTALSIFFELRALDRYAKATFNAYDTENTLTVDRFETAWRHQTGREFDELLDAGRVSFTDASVYMGNEWFEILKAIGNQRKNDRELINTTPFYNHRTKEYVKTIDPMLQFLDSLSGFTTDATEAAYDKNEIGDGGLNTVAIRAGNQKSQMIDQIPNVTSSAYIYLNATAHVGQDYAQSMDKYAGSSRKLQYLPNGKKMKKVPENFLFYPGWIIHVRGTRPLLDSNKQPQYPRDKDDAMVRDTDLMAMDCVIIRNKYGQTGIPVTFVLSQSEGVKAGLSELEYLKDNNGFGIGGNNINYHIQLYPNVNLTRKQVRGQIDNDPLLQRALEISSELFQLRHIRHEYRHLAVDPDVLRQGLIDRGYDMDTLLKTRGYWVPIGEEKGLPPFLSTMDLLNMYHGTYHPKWYPVAQKDLLTKTKDKAVDTKVEEPAA